MCTTPGFDNYGVGDNPSEATDDLIYMLKDLYHELRKDAKLSSYLEDKLLKLSRLFSDECYDE